MSKDFAFCSSPFLGLCRTFSVERSFGKNFDKTQGLVGVYVIFISCWFLGSPVQSDCGCKNEKDLVAQKSLTFFRNFVYLNFRNVRCSFPRFSYPLKHFRCLKTKERINHTKEAIPLAMVTNFNYHRNVSKTLPKHLFNWKRPNKWSNSFTVACLVFSHRISMYISNRTRSVCRFISIMILECILFDMFSSTPYRSIYFRFYPYLVTISTLWKPFILQIYVLILIKRRIWSF